ncbi:CaiB/BaiF CoA transferase family protein [Mycolicibacterium phlei]|uniref:CaiB/BaiF CoA transferase family protein n=1 Tax=Mycolicibacterium phlei TaxID=1771 RepID=UPI000791916A|nr:CoA transferase [Mycolicibacterium phlei]KXW69492.1 hypothetical protein MPHL43070_18715 [Mycolicibacterium phlei DSM 43070]KXW72616.1 hypothetical protein MPHL43072_02205 [Mycolicibacterium phlei DSM 43072]KXW79023.1 CoA-transferase [Mycolicibacterium phlei DSM 43071]
MTLPLQGVRVLELGNYIAAPTAGRLLADFGAEVIKVERPGTGDELRRWRLHRGDTSLLYRTINRNKKSVVIDLRTEEGRRDVKRLAAQCDIVLENFRPGTLEKWGIGPDELSADKPDLIVVRISAFGQTGPLAERPGFAAVAEAVGGLRELVGEEDRPPVRVGVSIGDSIAGLFAAYGAVMALHQRDKVRPQTLPLKSRVVDVALSESVLAMMESLIPDYVAYGVERKRIGGRVEGIAPSNAYRCKDGTIVIAGNSDGIFPRLMETIGRADLAADPDLAANDGRWLRRDELDGAIEAWTMTLSRDEALKRLEEAAVPSGPIYRAADIVADEQYRARDMIQYLPVDIGDGEVREVGFTGVVPVIGGRSLPIRSVGPDLGEHTEQVFRDLLHKAVVSE